MKKFTCTLALLLALLFGLSCLQPSALAAEGVAPAWNGIPATSFSGGSGTESDRYGISDGTGNLLCHIYTVSADAFL